MKVIDDKVMAQIELLLSLPVTDLEHLKLVVSQLLAIPIEQVEPWIHAYLELYTGRKENHTFH